MINWLLLFPSAGVCTGTGFLIMAAFGSYRFRRGVDTRKTVNLPPVTILKPLCGLEPNLKENLTSFFEQIYPNFELVFGMRDDTDPAFEVLQSVQQRYPYVQVKVAFSGVPARPNAKVCSLNKMLEVASHDYLVISDSDVYVSPTYLASVVRPLVDPAIGLVTCVYRGVPIGGIWSRLEALGMSVEMTAGVLASNILEGMTFALGPTMAIRRDVLESIGGFPALSDYCADDYVLGHAVHKAGWKVELSNYVIDHVVVNPTFSASILHQVRWMKSARFSRTWGHVSSVLSYCMPFALTLSIVAALQHRLVLALLALSYGWVNRMALSLVVGWGAVRDRRALRDAWLYPFRDLLGFLLWCASFLGNRIVWRNQVYKLLPGGQMQLSGLAIDGQSAPVSVDHLA